MQPAVYLMTDKPLGVLYTGVTSDLRARVEAHKEGRGSVFCAKYNCDKLVYFERHDSIIDAIAREKAVKAWRRVWKLELVVASNPEWRDLWGELHLL